MNAAEDAREEIAKVASVVMTARRLLASGTLLDLSAIEERVRALCDIMSALPRPEGGAIKDDALALMAKLDRLEAELKDQLAQIKRDLGD